MRVKTFNAPPNLSRLAEKSFLDIEILLTLKNWSGKKRGESRVAAFNHTSNASAFCWAAITS